MNWGPKNPEYLALTDLDIIRELARFHYWDLLQDVPAGTQVDVTEFEGDDEAFNEWERQLVEDYERKQAEARPADEFEEVKVEDLD